MAAFGGWGLDSPFRPAAATNESRTAFATAASKFVTDQALDGLDIDWEYPVGNGQFYKYPASDPQARPTDYSDFTTFPLLLQAIRTAVGPSKVISIACPGKPVDMMAYNSTSVPLISQSVDFWNLMSYDMVNRRDDTSGYHTSLDGVKEVISDYFSIGLSYSQMNIGFPLYAKWFRTAAACSPPSWLGCPFVPLEDQEGGDTGNSGSWTPATSVNVPNATIQTSYDSAMNSGVHNATAVADSWYDPTNRFFWTWISPNSTATICQSIIAEVGGIMVWSVGQDVGGVSGTSGPTFQALNDCFNGAS